MIILETGSILNEIIDGLREEYWMESPIWEEVSSTIMEEYYDYFPMYIDMIYTSYPYPLEREVKEFILKGSVLLSIELIIESEDNI